MARTIGIGVQNFAELRENNYFYIDKTLFIKEWWEGGDSATLISRPRRFGKTMNMSMIEQFFSVEYAGRGDLFEGLAIWEEEKYRNLQGTYPVISLSFANVKQTCIEETKQKINQQLADLYERNTFEKLLRGENIQCPIDEQIVYNQLDGSEASVWSLLLASGYLKVIDYERMEDLGDIPREPLYTLAVTNYEVQRMFYVLVSDWFNKTEADYNDFVQALLQEDLQEMNVYMNLVSKETFSYFDVGRAPSDLQPERFYHGFVLGLIVELAGRYVITSNRESGYGRYDVMLEPLNKEDAAFILEFKVHDSEREGSLKDTVAAALQQIEKKQYAAQLVARGIEPERIQTYGFAFEGKKVLIG